MPTAKRKGDAPTSGQSIGRRSDDLSVPSGASRDTISESITITEAAALAGVSTRTLRQAAKSGTLRTTFTPHGYLTTEAWLQQWQSTKRRGRPRKAA